MRIFTKVSEHELLKAYRKCCHQTSEAKLIIFLHWVLAFYAHRPYRWCFVHLFPIFFGYFGLPAVNLIMLFVIVYIQCLYKRIGSCVHHWKRWNCKFKCELNETVFDLLHMSEMTKIRALNAKKEHLYKATFLSLVYLNCNHRFLSSDGHFQYLACTRFVETQSWQFLWIIHFVRLEKYLQMLQSTRNLEKNRKKFTQAQMSYLDVMLEFQIDWLLLKWKKQMFQPPQCVFYHFKIFFYIEFHAISSVGFVFTLPKYENKCVHFFSKW